MVTEARTRLAALEKHDGPEVTKRPGGPTGMVRSGC